MNTPPDWLQTAKQAVETELAAVRQGRRVYPGEEDFIRAGMTVHQMSALLRELTGHLGGTTFYAAEVDSLTRTVGRLAAKLPKAKNEQN